MDFSGQHIPYNRELFAFLSGEQMGIPHGHGDVLMTHELLQFRRQVLLKRIGPQVPPTDVHRLAGLRQPGGKGMSHGVQGDGVQTVAVFRSQIELSDGGLETDGCFSNAVLLRGCWKMGSAGLRVYAWSIRIISSGRRTNTRFPPF